MVNNKLNSIRKNHNSKVKRERKSFDRKVKRVQYEHNGAIDIRTVRLARSAVTGGLAGGMVAGLISLPLLPVGIAGGMVLGSTAYLTKLGKENKRRFNNKR